MDTVLPQRFIQLSLNSLKTVQNHVFQLNQQTIQQSNSPETQAIRIKPQPISLKPNRQETTVAAVDTSSMKIGETDTGMLIAVRGATIWRQRKQYRYVRIGPFIFHTTDENKRELYTALQTAYFNFAHERAFTGMLNLMQMPMRIASLLEKWLQASLARTMTNSLVLFDGSLTAGTSDAPTQQMKQLLATARNRNNAVLAFSKMTNLRTNGYLITDALPPHKPPCMLETDGLRQRPPMMLLGDVYVARLTGGSCAFRLDIDKEMSLSERVEAVERLLGNDLLQQSYPETLRLAHILCTFTANEVIAMQHFITRQHRLRIVNRPDMHRLLFGPFGRGDVNA